jgi:nicotinamide-nucleotide amidase
MMESAKQIIETLKTRGETITCAESITGGALTSAIVSVPGASHVLKGSIIAYAPEIKVQELQIAPELIRDSGVVSEDVAIAMAAGARKKFAADWALGLTGVAGPGPSHEVPAGTVWLAVLGPNHQETVKLALSGDRENVRRGAVESALGVLARILSSSSTSS